MEGNLCLRAWVQFHDCDCVMCFKRGRAQSKLKQSVFIKEGHSYGALGRQQEHRL
jgi:hypothetical protein